MMADFWTSDFLPFVRAGWGITNTLVDARAYPPYIYSFLVRRTLSIRR